MAKVSSAVAAKGAAIDQEISAATVVPPVVDEPEINVPTDDAVAAAPTIDGGAGVEAPAEQVLSPLEEARAVVDMAVELLVPMYPELGPIYPPEVCDRIARVSAPLLSKYGVTAGSLFAKWKEEIAFSAVMLPLVMKSARAMKSAAQANTQKPPRAEAPDGGNELGGHPATNAPASTQFGYKNQAEEDAAYKAHMDSDVQAPLGWK